MSSWEEQPVLAETLNLPREPEVQLARLAAQLGLSPDQAATLLRNEGAEERIRALNNLEVIAEQGDIEQKLDLRLVPYRASLTFSVATPRNKDSHDSIVSTGQCDLTVMRTLNGFSKRQVDSRTLVKTPKFFTSAPSVELGVVHSQAYNEAVFLAGTRYNGSTQGTEMYKTLPYVAKMGSLAMSRNTEQKDDIPGGCLFQGTDAYVTAIVLNYPENEPLTVFGEPFVIAQK
jgi:hypothetical protein